MSQKVNVSVFSGSTLLPTDVDSSFYAIYATGTLFICIMGPITLIFGTIGDILNFITLSMP